MCGSRAFYAAVSLTLLLLPAGSSQQAWTQPETHPPRPDPFPSAQPEVGTPYIFALLGDELFGSNREKDLDDELLPVGQDFVKHFEQIGAAAVNIGATPWNGTLRLIVPDLSVDVRENVEIPPMGLHQVNWYGYIDKAPASLALRAEALEGEQVVDALEQVGDFYQEYPIGMPVGAVFREVDHPASVPHWMPGMPYAASVLNTNGWGYTHIEQCVDVGHGDHTCTDYEGMFPCCLFRWLSLAVWAAGETCLRSHVDLYRPREDHVWDGASDDEACFNATAAPAAATEAQGGRPSSSRRTPGFEFFLVIPATLATLLGRRRT